MLPASDASRPARRSDPPRRDLGGGLAIRTATDDDVDGIVAVETAAFGPADGPGIRAAIEVGGGPADWAVVVDGDAKVVSASALLDLDIHVSGAGLPAGQIEWVATYPEFQRRGLVRAQFERHHRLSADRGHLVTLIAGIPYLYRRLGYGYGLDYPTLYIFDDAHVRAQRTDDDVTTRAALERDIPAMWALEATRAQTGVGSRRDERFWQQALAASRGDRSRYERCIVAERNGEVCGWLTGKLDDEIDKRLHCKPGAAADAAAADALVADMVELAHDRGVLLIADGSPGSPYGARLAELGKAIELYSGYYTRTPDPVALLAALRPVLSERLRAAPRYAERSGTLELSLYNSGVAIDYERGAIIGVRAVPGAEDPLADFGVGVAPDWFGALVLGRWGATELARRIDDVILGRHGGLMDTLFPKLPCDIAADL